MAIMFLFSMNYQIMSKVFLQFRRKGFPEKLYSKEKVFHQYEFTKIDRYKQPAEAFKLWYEFFDGE